MLNKLLKECRTVRRFDKTKPVSETELNEALCCVSLIPSAGNLQRIRYAAVCGAEAEDLFPSIALGGYLPEEDKPGADVAPTAYAVLFTESENPDINLSIDIGIAAEAIVLSLREKGISSCIVRNFKKEAFMPFAKGRELVPQLVIAMGYAAERVKLITLEEGGSVKYFKMPDGTNAVPKYPPKTLIIK